MRAASADAQTIRRHGTLTGHDEMLRVHRGGHEKVLRTATTQHRFHHGASLCRGFRRLCIRSLKELRDHKRKHFDMADFLSGDVHEHIAVFGRTAAIPALEQILHHYGHLAPLAADHLLQLRGEQRIGTVGFRAVLEFWLMNKHGV